MVVSACSRRRTDRRTSTEVVRCEQIAISLGVCWASSSYASRSGRAVTGGSAIARSLEHARNGVLKAANGAREVSYNQREVGNTLVAEQTLGLDGATKYVKVIAGVGHERMRVVQASCNASQARCAAVLASLVLDPTELDPLSSVSNRVVYGVATLVGILIGGLIGWRIISRRIRRRPAGPALIENQGKRLLLAIGLALLLSIGWNLIFR